MVWTIWPGPEKRLCWLHQGEAHRQYSKLKKEETGTAETKWNTASVEEYKNIIQSKRVLMSLLSQTSCWPSLRPVAQSSSHKTCHPARLCGTYKAFLLHSSWISTCPHAKDRFHMSFPFLIEHICKFLSRLTKGNLLKYSDNGVASRHACSSSQCCFSI